jgi:hypothetical protein
VRPRNRIAKAEEEPKDGGKQWQEQERSTEAETKVQEHQGRVMESTKARTKEQNYIKTPLFVGSCYQ